MRALALVAWLAVCFAIGWNIAERQQHTPVADPPVVRLCEIPPQWQKYNFSWVVPCSEAINPLQV